MVTLYDLFDHELFLEMQDAGFVRVQRHPEFPDKLAIINYTHKAQQNYHWNDVTEQCRGLIFHPKTGEILARPFRKFYNFDEKRADKIVGSENVKAFDKLDGSLGIAYMRPDGRVAVATRGSFTSTQAMWATNWLADKMRMDPAFYWDVEGTTDLFEIIYPENRIVVSYDTQGLTYLGSVAHDTGRFIYDPVCYAGEATKILYEGNYANIFTLPDRVNAEGLVVVTEDGRRVKYKYDEYIRLHRIVSDLTPKRVWEAMGGPFMDVAERMAADIPEEHSNWLLAEANELVGLYISCATYLSEIAHRTENITTRKEKALAVKDEEPWVKACYFAALDGKRFDQILWKFLEPKGDA